jgi:hypothetical protein
VVMRTWKQVRTVYNLTVDGVHTYYVVAGDAPVLVHNCGKSVALYRNVDAAEFDDIAQAGKFRSGEGSMGEMVHNQAGAR